MAETDSAAEPSNPEPVESIEVETGVRVKDEDAAEDDSGNEADDVAEDAAGGERAVSREQYKALKNIADVLSNFKIKIKNEDYYPAQLFKRIPNRRVLPDYHEIIKDPVAISTLKQKIQRKSYTGIPEFVRDFAMIVQNAQIYNRPKSAPVRDVLSLQDVFKAELKKLVEEGVLKEEETVFPDLGPIPDATPEADQPSEEDEEADEDAEEDEEDEDADADESDDDGRRNRRRKGARPSVSDLNVPRRRGRPPKVDTPMEARIKAILKGLRKPKDDAGNLKVLPFEKLPAPNEAPGYAEQIKNPIALDNIKKKAKRKKYPSVDHFMKDVDLLFNNAKTYNQEGSDIYQDAVDLQAEAHRLAEIEKAKSDDEYLDEDGRRPLPAGILHNNELWKVGDWVHIKNPNDVTKPIVAQIFRTWEDAEGKKWINACWYYRPEQTVHQYEKHFLMNEVVKTGQYRDHAIEEVSGRCYVMFVTKFGRGRPKEVDPTKDEVYVCEARYNEDKHRFNKIKTWASCLPDEVRDKQDYPMNLFDIPQKIKKVPSPLLHLLKDDMKPTDEIPSPRWGDPNAPPVEGAIHKQPRDENQSPPPEPTPPPPPTPLPQISRQPSISTIGNMAARPSINGQSSPASGNLQPQLNRPSPSLTPQVNSYQALSISPAPTYGRQNSYQPSQPHIQAAITPQTPASQTPLPYTAHQQLHPAPNLAATHSPSYAPAAAATTTTPSTGFGRPQLPASQPYTSYPSNIPEHREQPVYILSNEANAQIPTEIRDKLPQDSQGRVLFFTQPPVLHDWTVRGQDGLPLRHTERYLKAKAEKEKLRSAKKRALEEEAKAAKKMRI